MDENINLLDTFNKDTNFHLMHEAKLDLWDVMAFTGNKTSRTVEFLRFCSETRNSSTYTIQPSETLATESVLPVSETESLVSSFDSGETTSEGQFVWPDQFNEDDCDDKFEEFKQKFSHITAYTKIKYDKNLYNLDEAFGDDKPDNKQAEKCRNTTNEIKGEIFALLFTLEFSVSLIQSDNFKDALSYAEALVHWYINITYTYDYNYYYGEYYYFYGDDVDHDADYAYFQNISKYIEEYCSWVRDYAQTEKTDITRAIGEIASIPESIRRTEPLLRRWVDILKDIILREKFRIETLINNYKWESITKAKLAEEFISPNFIDFLQELYTNSSEMKRMIQDYTNELHLIRDLLWHGIKSEVLPSDLRIITSQNEDELRYIQKAKSSPGWPWGSGEIITKIPEAIKEGPLHEAHILVTEQLDVITKGLQTLDLRLREYQLSIQMDSDFFM